MTKKSSLIIILLLGISLFSGFVNNLFIVSAVIWLFVGSLLGYFLMELDHLVHLLVLKPNELTSQRFLSYLKLRDIGAAFKLIQITIDERRGTLLFRQEFFQYIFYLLSYILITSSGNLFAKGLILGVVVNFAIFNYRYLQKMFLPSLLALFIFIFLI